MDKPLDYAEIYKHESYIQEVLQYHTKKYKYVGEKGEEYGVIQSIFYEINKLSGLFNQHIRWYAIIIFLVHHFYEQRNTVLLEGYPLTDPGQARAIKVTADLDEDSLQGFFVPKYIDLAEMYFSGVARLGILASAKQVISQEYFNKRLVRLAQQMTELLNKLKMNNEDNPKEDIFLLSLKNSTDNISLLRNLIFKESQAYSIDQLLDWQAYQCLITERVLGLSEKRVADCYNMDAFWNGFIP
jgi:hypothetical protein